MATIAQTYRLLNGLYTEAASNFSDEERRQLADETEGSMNHYLGMLSTAPHHQRSRLTNNDLGLLGLLPQLTLSPQSNSTDYQHQPRLTNDMHANALTGLHNQNHMECQHDQAPTTSTSFQLGHTTSFHEDSGYGTNSNPEIHTDFFPRIPTTPLPTGMPPSFVSFATENTPSQDETLVDVDAVGKDVFDTTYPYIFRTGARFAESNDDIND